MINLQLFAVTKTIARGWKTEINTGTEATPVWTEVKGLTSVSFSAEKNDADTTSFDSGGWTEHLTASRTRSFSAEGYFLEDPTTGDRDPGQEAIETAGDQIGPASLRQFQLSTPAGNKYKFTATVGVGEIGGGNDDPTSWGFECSVSGSVTYTPLP